MFKLTIRIDNDAFKDDAAVEVARILRRLARDIVVKDVESGMKLYDVNGNAVGTITFTGRKGQ